MGKVFSNFKGILKKNSRGQDRNLVHSNKIINMLSVKYSFINDLHNFFMPNHKSSAYMISQHYAVIWHASYILDYITLYTVDIRFYIIIYYTII